MPIFGDDAALRDEKSIRVTDMAFDEEILLDQDRYLLGGYTKLRTSTTESGPGLARALYFRPNPKQQRPGE